LYRKDKEKLTPPSILQQKIFDAAAADIRPGIHRKRACKDLPVVHNGGEASSLWGNLPSFTDRTEIDSIRRGLLEYCKLDTLAMVEILKVLRELSH